MDKSKRALLDAQSVIVCEGQLDLIACYMAGVQNIVAPQGTALTADHARILKRYVDEVVLCFDSDNAGQNAAVRSLDSLLASGLAIRVAVVPAPHDPDSFIKQSGGEAFKQLITRAEGFFDYYLNRLCATNDLATDKGRLAVLESMAESVHKTGNVVLVDKYAQKTALRLGVAPEAVRTEFKKLSRSKRATLPAEVAANEASESDAQADARVDAETSAETRPGTTEYWLLKLLLLHDETMEWVCAHLDPHWVQHSRVREIVILRLGLRGLRRLAGEWRLFSRNAKPSRCGILLPKPPLRTARFRMPCNNSVISPCACAISSSTANSARFHNAVASRIWTMTNTSIFNVGNRRCGNKNASPFPR